MSINSQNREIFWSRLMDARERHRRRLGLKSLSFARIASETGVKATTIKGWRKHTPGVDRVRPVAQFLGVSVESLYEESEIIAIEKFKSPDKNNDLVHSIMEAVRSELLRTGESREMVLMRTERAVAKILKSDPGADRDTEEFTKRLMAEVRARLATEGPDLVARRDALWERMSRAQREAWVASAEIMLGDPGK